MQIPRRIERFGRYAIVGGGTLAFDLLLVYAATELFGISYLVSVPVCFLIAVSINYFISRRTVFKGTTRHIHHGYLYFILFAVAGSFAVTAGVAFLVSAFALHYLFARVLVAGVVGCANYLLNLFWNFQVAGKPLRGEG